MGWIVFNLFIILMLVLDQAVFNKKAHEVKIKEALVWSLFWILLALAFNWGIYHFQGPDAAVKFFTGYLLERVLSIDNLFVFLLIFSYFKVPPVYHQKILAWGILGALVMRAFFILAGIALIHHFEWVLYVFGAILVISGMKLFKEEEKEIHPDENPVIKLFTRMAPISKGYDSGRFFLKQNGKFFFTPLFVVLLMIETTDVIFAVDSIPAILGITTDPFIVYTSNIFAILGLRALYFALAGMMQIFHFLHYGLGFLLIFIGAKMLAHEWVHISIYWTLGVIAVTLLICIAASILYPKKEPD